MGRSPSTRNGIRAGSLIAAGALGGGIVPVAHTLAQPAPEPSRAVQYVDLRANWLHAGSTGADVERVLGQPTAATKLGAPGSGDIALVYASAPVRTKVVLTANRVTSIALDVVYIDPEPLPMRARAIKATMVRNGLTGLLGTPAAEQRWTDAGRDFEQVTYASAGEPEFSVFLVDGLVVDVRLGHDRPAGLGCLVLPVASVSSELAIGQSPAHAALLLGPMDATVHFALEGQPVDYTTYHERDGGGLVTVTFMGGVLTAFHIWRAGELLAANP